MIVLDHLADVHGTPPPHADAPILTGAGVPALGHVSRLVTAPSLPHAVCLRAARTAPWYDWGVMLAWQRSAASLSPDCPEARPGV
jgi:hypothetical protein